MARYGRFALVLLVSLAIASTGLCMALSVPSSCSIAQPAAVEDSDSCCEDTAANDRGCNPADGTCPASKERPTCRMCDDTVAFLLEGKTDGAKTPLARTTVVAVTVTRPAASVRAQADSLHLSKLSSSPPLHLLNVVFRN